MVTVEKVVDVDQMLKELKTWIEQIYQQDLKANEVQLTDDDPPLELLQTLEQKIVQRQAKIEERRKPTAMRPTAAEEIRRFEIQQKTEFKKERQEDEAENLRKVLEEAKKKTEERMLKDRKREGKIQMPRS